MKVTEIRIWTLLLGMNLSALSLWAQDVLEPQIYMPSPDASAMIKSANIPVDHSTGIPSVQVPLFSLPAKDDLQANVSLNYHASGIKVRERSSVVGTGWNLVAGGTITRIVRGKPDWFGVEDRCDLDGLLQIAASPYCDMAPDIFYFNFLGRGGRFFISNENIAFTQPYQNLDIKFSKHQYNWAPEGNDPKWANSFYDWRITDEQGYTFVFGNLSKAIETTRVMLDGEQKENFESTWHLTKVLSPSGEEILTFNYSQTDELEVTNKVQSVSKVIYEEDDPTIYQTSEEVFSSQVSSVFTKPSYLNSIVSSYGEIKLFYAGLREDLSNGKMLIRVDLNNHLEHRVSTYFLYHSYFNGWNSRHSGNSSGMHSFYDQTYIDEQNWDPNSPYTLEDLPVRRLKLDRITKAVDLSPLDERMYRSFVYNSETGLPDYDSEFIDHYGYYNGGNAQRSSINSSYNYMQSYIDENLLPNIYVKADASYVSDACAITDRIAPYCETSSSVIREFNAPGRKSSFLDAKANILEEIHFATGGYQKIEYESSGYNAAVIRVARISIYDSNGEEIDYMAYSYTNPITFGKPVYHRTYPHIQGGKTLVVSSQSFSDFFDVNGSPIRYGTVQVNYKNGMYQNFEYNNDSDLDPLISYYRNSDLEFEHNLTSTKSPFAPATTQFWKRGLIKKISTHITSRKSDKLLSQVNFNYELDASNVNLTEGYTSNYVSGFGGVHYWDIGTYYYISQPVILSSKIEKTYDQENDNYESVRTNYSYDPATLQLLETEVVSDGYPTYTTEYKYANHNDYDVDPAPISTCFHERLDCLYNCPPDIPGCQSQCEVEYEQCMEPYSEAAIALLRMRQRHMVNIPVEQKKWLEGEDGVKKLMSSNLIIFGLEGNDKQFIRPQSLYTMDGLRTDYLESNDSHVDSEGNFVKSPDFRKVKTFDLYSATTGKLLRETDLTGITTGYEWDDEENYLLATTVNGQRAEVTYKPLVGKETETDVNGNVTTYEYDLQDRLKQIKLNGEVVKQFNYQLINE